MAAPPFSSGILNAVRRLDNSITGGLARTYGYDAAGNTLSYAGMTATYKNSGRLKTVQNATTTAQYFYNALGQRIKQNAGAPGTVLYMYDEAGHLIGEYNGTGALIEETVWLGNIPVATLRPNGAALAAPLALRAPDAASEMLSVMIENKTGFRG